LEVNLSVLEENRLRKVAPAPGRNERERQLTKGWRATSTASSFANLSMPGAERAIPYSPDRIG
jgi:hypothetical protein